MSLPEDIHPTNPGVGGAGPGEGPGEGPGAGPGEGPGAGPGAGPLGDREGDVLGLPLGLGSAAIGTTEAGNDAVHLGASGIRELLSGETVLYSWVHVSQFGMLHLTGLGVPGYSGAYVHSNLFVLVRAVPQGRAALHFFSPPPGVVLEQ